MIDYTKILSETVVGIKPSGIRKFFDIASTMEGVISLGVGEPDFRTPWQIRSAGIHSLERGRTKYSANRGLEELRQEISKYVERKCGILKQSERTECGTVKSAGDGGRDQNDGKSSDPASCEYSGGSQQSRDRLGFGKSGKYRCCSGKHQQKNRSGNKTCDHP